MKNILILISLFLTTFYSHAQSSFLYNKAEQRLIKIIGRNIRVSREVGETQASFIFSLRFVINEDGRLDTVMSSKLFPKALADVVLDKSLYNGVEWKEILKNNPRMAIILPVTVTSSDYDGLKAFGLKGIIEQFNFPGVSQSSMECYLMQPFSIVYSPPIK
ncbi:hypothetical protein [Chitinophaga qingshengii]|uniref:TonB C-terminal domain-containing protein n=1 Tax=Chitinophaga qingshengii TaxID=1569794 RepID=A0ABR7TSP8_9BACT|nr:hypothetical protein [Chitinophaga qingshengii]MBC9932004.1 hypothetical protein [Chitinophaga qingshengii]